jgi:predicted nuclease of predicted toxin-antitoxin system
MKILIDMNLSPLWVEALRQGGHDAVHWSQVGDPGAPDRVLMEWAITGNYVSTGLTANRSKNKKSIASRR